MQVPRSKSVKPHPVSGMARINLTFRRLDPESAARAPRCKCGQKAVLKVLVSLSMLPLSTRVWVQDLSVGRVQAYSHIVWRCQGGLCDDHFLLRRVCCLIYATKHARITVCKTFLQPSLSWMWYRKREGSFIASW